MQIGDQVAEAVDFEHRTRPGTLAGPGRAMKGKLNIIVDEFTEAYGRDP